VAATLYVIPGSHPAMTARLMLEQKGIRYRRVDLMPVISKLALKALRFPGVTVPALRIDGRRIQGSRQIARELDRIQPEPRLFPPDPGARLAVEEAERFGDEDLQGPVRRILWNAIRRDRSVLASYARGTRLGVPIGPAVKAGKPLVALATRLNKADDVTVHHDLATLPGMLKRIDDWCEEGVLGGEEPNAADFQIAPSLRLLITLDDLRPWIVGRPAGEMAMRIVPEFPGRTPAILPGLWLEPLREAATAKSA